jgi:hypothetical protein
MRGMIGQLAGGEGGCMRVRPCINYQLPTGTTTTTTTTMPHLWAAAVSYGGKVRKDGGLSL